MSSTLIRLNEAKFFLEKIETSAIEERQYYLNAFIKSSRSITWILKNEFDKVYKWHEWYEKLRPTKDEESILKYFNELRVQSEKIRPVEENSYIEFDIKDLDEDIKNKIYKLPFGEPIDITIDYPDDEDEVEENIEGIEINHVNNKNIDNFESISFKLSSDKMKLKDTLFIDDKRETIELCKQYYSILKNVVIESFIQFGANVKIEPCQYKLDK